MATEKVSPSDLKFHFFSPVNTIIIVIYTIVPLVSWVYVNVARALTTPIPVALVAIIAWYATAEMDITVKIAEKRVSYHFIEMLFEFFYCIQLHGDIIFSNLKKKSNCINSDFMR